MSGSGVRGKLSAVLRAIFVDLKCRFPSLRGLFRDVVVPGVILEGIVLLLCVSLSDGSFPVRLDIIGTAIGLCFFVVLMSTIDKQKLRFWANTVPAFRYDCFRVCRVLLCAMAGVLVLLPSWLILHSYACILWFVLTLATCLFLSLFVSGQYPLVCLVGVLLADAFSFVFHRPWIASVVAMAGFIPMIMGFSGIDRLRYRRSPRLFTSAFSAMSNLMSNLRDRSSGWEIPLFGHSKAHALLSSLSHPHLTELMLIFVGFCVTLLALYGPHYTASASYLAAFLAALALCDQIGVNLVSRQRRSWEQMKKEGINVLPLIRRQITAFVLLTTVVPLCLFVVATYEIFSKSLLWALALVLGQACLYVCMAFASLLLSTRCQAIPYGMYGIRTRNVLYFELACTLVAIPLDILSPGMLVILLPVALTMMRSANRMTMNQFVPTKEATLR